jgi:opacity protein-like surface antigen
MKVCLAVLMVGLVLLPTVAGAQSQVISFNVGGFITKGEDGRVEGDVLVENLRDFNPLAYEISDFNGATVGADWLFGIGDLLEAGVGVGFYRRTVPSVYRDLVRPGGGEIEQDLRLRIIPITASVRFFPMGRTTNGLQPYLGGGLAVLNWRYSETGEFVDPLDDTLFRTSYVKSGTSTAPVFLGGLRFPLADAFLLGGEARYQRAEGDLPLGGTDGFLGDKIDLGGWTVNVTMGVRF